MCAVERYGFIGVVTEMLLLLFVFDICGHSISVLYCSGVLLLNACLCPWADIVFCDVFVAGGVEV